MSIPFARNQDVTGLPPVATVVNMLSGVQDNSFQHGLNIPHTCVYIQPTYIPHTYKIVGTQFCVTLSHPSFRTFILKRMDHTDIKSKDFSSDNKTHTYYPEAVQ